MKISIECYAGHRGEERPRRILMEGRAIEIKEILDRWVSPDHRFFKVLGDDNTVYLLRHDPRGCSWDLR